MRKISFQQLENLTEATVEIESSLMTENESPEKFSEILRIFDSENNFLITVNMFHPTWHMDFEK